MFTDAEQRAAAELLDACRNRGLTIATAESCTGGLIGGLLTEIAGSSDVFERGFITYANDAKTEVLGVPAMLIAQHGAVSEPVARAMAQGALAASPAGVAVAVTGVAGPGGGTADKPVGLVHMAVALRDGEIRHIAQRYGDIGRSEVRRATVRDAIALMHNVMGVMHGE